MALPLLLLVLLAGAAPAQVPGAAALSGTAYDHLVGAPLAGVRVALSGASSRTATTDEHGGFHLAELPPGEYRVSVMDRRLELLSAFPPVVRIELPRGGHRQLQLGTPSRETLLDALCGSREAALVYGFVLDREGGHPLRGATVELRWSESTARGLSAVRTRQRWVHAVTDAAGGFRTCSVAPGVEAQIRIVDGPRVTSRRVRTGYGVLVPVEIRASTDR